MTITRQCPAAHDEDTRACVGSTSAVRVVDQAGGVAEGCVLHSAVLLASLVNGRVYPGSCEGAAIAVHELARDLEPFAWRGDLASQRAAELRQHHVKRAPS